MRTDHKVAAEPNPETVWLRGDRFLAELVAEYYDPNNPVDSIERAFNAARTGVGTAGEDPRCWKCGPVILCENLDSNKVAEVSVGFTSADVNTKEAHLLYRALGELLELDGGDAEVASEPDLTDAEASLAFDGHRLDSPNGGGQTPTNDGAFVTSRSELWHELFILTPSARFPYEGEHGEGRRYYKDVSVLADAFRTFCARKESSADPKSEVACGSVLDMKPELTDKERDAILQLLASAFGIPEDGHGLFNDAQHQRLLRKAQKKLFAQRAAADAHHPCCSSPSVSP